VNQSTTNQKQYKPFAELRMDAAGKWPYIFEDLAPELAEAMSKAPHHVSCPCHGGADGFRLFRDYAETGGGICNSCGAQPGGFGMLAWIRGYDIKDAIRDVARWLEGDSGVPAPERRKPIAPPAPTVDFAQAYDRIRKVWTSSKDLLGSPAERYLAARGIWKENMPKTLRVHDSLTYIHGKEKKNYGKFPCLLAPIKDKDGRIVSIHRIFLTPEGAKAPVPDAKKMMSRCGELRGAAIKLFQAGETLGLAEGIETALAAHAISRMPVWSCVSAVLLEQVHIPDSVKHVVIWADLDVSNRGLQAAEKLAERLVAEGKTVEICLPACSIPEGSKGVDWLDVLLTQGINGFPAKWRRWRPTEDVAKAA
jgi:hypothetical protein